MNASRAWPTIVAALLLAPAGCRDEGEPGIADDSATDGTETDGPDDGETDEPPGEAEAEQLTPVEHLIRVSMALRGTRPSIEEIAMVEEDPDAIAMLVDEYMEAPQFGEVIRDLHDDALLVEVDLALPAVEPLDGLFPQTIGRSVMQTPLRLAEHVVVQDRPYTELVTADYWVGDDVAATVYGVPYDQGGPQWQELPLTDDRPAAGVLSDTAFYVRHASAGDNYNRGRANAISRALLCMDFLVQDIDVSGGIDLSDPEAVANAVVENEACAACHDPLDPLASHLFGFPNELDVVQYFDDVEEAGGTPAYPLPQIYQPQQEGRWEGTNERPPAYFGVETEDLADLGQQIAADPRFTQCAARRFYAYFNQVRLEDAPSDRVAELQAVLEDSGFDAKALVREVVLGDDFRASHSVDETVAETLVGYKKARPFQLDLMLEDLTGFRWELDVGLLGQELGEPLGEGTISLARNSLVGFSVLAGAGDSLFVTEASNTVNATTSLVLRTLAAEAASFVVERELALEPGQRRLLTALGDDPSDEVAVRAQLAELMLRLFGQHVEPESAEVDEVHAVFAATLERTGDASHAWKTTLTALLQDLQIIYY